MNVNETRKTITQYQLKKLSFCNSKKLPQLIELKSDRYRWVGIGWVNEGKPTGKEVLVTV